MGKSYNTNWYPQADYKEGDQGDFSMKTPEEIQIAWDNFDDQEVNRLLETDNDTPL